MDFTPLLKSFEEHTKALFVHAAAIEKLIAHAGSTQDTAAAPKGPGRPRKETAPAADPVSTAATVTVQQPVSSSAVTSATVLPAASATGKPLTHLDLKESFLAFAKAKGRDAIVALLGEFGASEFGKVKTDDLPLFKARLEGQPQTPVAANDATNLLGL